MTYRKKKLHWKKSRYSQYFEKVSGLTDARKKLALTLSKVYETQSQSYWKSVVPILESMREEFKNLGPIPDRKKSVLIIKYCLNFLDITSRYQDLLNGGLEGAPDSKMGVAEKFNNDLTVAGRHTKDEKMESTSGEMIPCWNTTVKGEPITEDNIFFGPDIGLMQYPARYWINLKKSKKVNMYITKHFAKGIVKQNQPPLWATDALVKYSFIFYYCKTGYNLLTKHLDELLD